jgi:ligand-binding sensor domain-containing protein/two-component sensor histidine kinase
MSKMKVVLRAMALFFLYNTISLPEAWCQLPVITFEVITSKDGLPSNTVLSAVRDSAGFMWFGTRLCPVRYDGSTFRSFTDYTTNFVNGIKADRKDNIWISSDRSGISVIDPQRRRMTHVPRADEQTRGSTGDFYIDKRGEGWYSDHHGVNRINLNTGRHHHYPFRQTNFVWLKGSFVEDLDSNLWVIGRDNGLFRYDREKDTLYCLLGADSPCPDKLGTLMMSKGTVGKDGCLWIGTYTHGLLRFDPRTGAVKTFSTGRPGNEISCVEEGLDENGRRVLWVGDDYGLGIFRQDGEEFYFFPDILPKQYKVNDIYRDPDGIIWVGTSDGIIKYHPLGNAIQRIIVPRLVMPDAFEVNVVHQDQRSDYPHIFYLGLSNNILLQWDRKKNEFSRITYPGGEGETRWIKQKDDQTLWIGTNRWDFKRPGIHVYDLSTEKFLKPPLSGLANRYFSVPFFMYGKYDKGTLWIGNSDEGIHALDENSVQEITPWSEAAMKNLIGNNNLINAMLVSENGRLYVGTYNGIYYYDNSSGQFLSADPQSMPEAVDDRAVNSLLEDRNGNLWAARWGSVTMTANGKIEKVLNLTDGFNDREIKGLAEDTFGNIWIGNHEGLYRYNPTTGHLIKFTMNDGLISNNTVGRVFQANDGQEVLIGQSQGFNVVKVDRFPESFEPPLLAVNSFKIHQTEYPINANEPIRLKPAQNVFSVDFVALNYRKPEDNQYAYYLEGFEDSWNHIGSNHVAYYTNLSPGKYTLHIKAGNAYGTWSEKSLDMNIEVLPALYQTIWFKILISLFGAGLLYAFYRYRINQLLRLQQVRNRISADLHDELGSTLSGISIMGSLAKKELSNQQTSGLLIERIMEDVRQISGSLDDIIWNISPRNDSLSSLAARMTRYASELFEAKQIPFKLAIPLQLDDIKLSMEQRRNIYLIFKEAINNLVKYSECTQAFVNLRLEKRNVFLTVKDNGIGFDPNALTERNGIRNIKSRAASLKGEVEIQSISGMGTTIILQFPVVR